MSQLENTLTYDEALAKSFQVPWKTSQCIQGEKCWCRIIEPVDRIIYDGDEEVYIAGSGAIPKEYAEYIVDLHNQRLKLIV